MRRMCRPMSGPGGCVFSIGLREVSREHRWAREDEVDSLRECNVEELWRDGADAHRKSGVSILGGLHWGAMRELEARIRNAMRGSRACVRVCVDQGARAVCVACVQVGPRRQWLGSQRVPRFREGCGGGGGSGSVPNLGHSRRRLRRRAP